MNTIKKIDYEATIASFLESASKYLRARAYSVKNVERRRNIERNICILQKYKLFPNPYLNMDDTQMSTHGMRWDALVFDDNKNQVGPVGQAFDNVMIFVRKYYTCDMPRREFDALGRTGDGRAMLDAIKQWNYAKSPTRLKGWLYPMLNSRYFAQKQR